MKKIIISVFVASFLFVISSPVFSEGLKFGIGASATSSGSTIYFPIKTDSFIIEPMIRYRQADYDSDSATMIRDRDMKEVSIGSGFFLYSSIFEKADLIYGCRIGYLETRQEEKQVIESTSRKSEFDTSGFFAAPTVGIEYNFNSHISVGCNISIEYQRLTGDETYNAPTEEKLDIKNIDYSTHTDLFIKYYF